MTTAIVALPTLLACLLGAGVPAQVVENPLMWQPQTSDTSPVRRNHDLASMWPVTLPVVRRANAVKSSRGFTVTSQNVGLLGRASDLAEILAHLKRSRDAVVAVFDAASHSLSKTGHLSDAQEMQRWTNSWLSLAGVTALASDFTVNYLGRSAYHHANGHFVRALERVLPDIADPSADHVASMRLHALRACQEGRKLFAEGGSLHAMLFELHTLLTSNAVAQHIESAIRFHPTAKESLQYVVGPRPRSSSDSTASLLEMTPGATTWGGVMILTFVFTVAAVTASTAGFVFVHFYGKVALAMKHREFPPLAETQMKTCPYHAAAS